MSDLKKEAQLIGNVHQARRSSTVNAPRYSPISSIRYPSGSRTKQMRWPSMRPPGR
jgi:hypothetical protein